MVPTEVLAEQHFFAVQALTESLVVEDPGRLEGRRPVRTVLLTNRTTARSGRASPPTWPAATSTSWSAPMHF